MSKKKVSKKYQAIDSCSPTHREISNGNNPDYLDLTCSFLVPLNESIRDWDHNAVGNSSGRNCSNADFRCPPSRRRIDYANVTGV